MKRFSAACLKGGIPATKVGSCQPFEGTPSKILIFTQDWVDSIPFDGVNIETIQDGIDEGLIIPITEGIVNYEPTGGDSRALQEGFGETMYDGWNAKTGVYTIVKGGMCLLSQLMILDGQLGYIAVVDEKGFMVATIDNKNALAEGVTNSNTLLKSIRGFKCNIGVAKRDNTGAQVGAILLSIALSNEYFNEMQNVISVDVTDETLEPLASVVVDVRGGNIFTVDECSGEVVTGVAFVPADFQTSDGSAVTYSALTGAVTVAAGVRVSMKVGILSATGWVGTETWRIKQL